MNNDYIFYAAAIEREYQALVSLLSLCNPGNKRMRDAFRCGATYAINVNSARLYISSLSGSPYLRTHFELIDAIKVLTERNPRFKEFLKLPINE